MLDAEKHVGKPVVARFQCQVQHLLQRVAGIYRRIARKGKRQQGQLHRNTASLHRGQQGKPRTRQGQFRPRHREMPEGHQTTRHKETPGMEQVEEENGKGHRMAEQKGIQPLYLEGMAAHGQVAVHAGQIRGSSIHVLIHEPPLRHTAGHLRQGEGVARKMLHGTGLALRRGGRDYENQA